MQAGSMRVRNQPKAGSLIEPRRYNARPGADDRSLPVRRIAKSMSGIFISYRREDAAGHAGRLFDRLAQHFGRDQVFMDVAGIDPGVDFVEAIEQAVGSCGVLIVVIGKQWAQATDAAGRRRLEDDNDFVRLETATALKRNVRVIPLLVESAPLPSPESLPEDLRALTRRNAFELRDSRWEADIVLLTNALEKVLGPGTAPAGAALNTGKASSSPRRGWTPYAVGGAVLAVSVLAIALWFAAGKGGDPDIPLAKPVSPTAGPAPEQSTSVPATAAPAVQDASVPQVPAPTAAPERKMPRFVGLPARTARAQIAESGLRVARWSQRQVTDAGQVDRVVWQRPAAGATIEKGAGVEIAVGVQRAPPHATVPELVGLSMQEALNALEQAGLKLGRRSGKASAREPGTILRQSISGGTRVTPGSTVDLVYAARQASQPAPQRDSSSY
jgi:hypothetical protein